MGESRLIDGIFTCHVAVQKLVTAKCDGCDQLWLLNEVMWVANAAPRGVSSPYKTPMTSSRCRDAAGEFSKRGEDDNLLIFGHVS